MARLKSAALKKMVFAILRMSGVPYLVRELVQRQKVTILVYHKLAPEVAAVHFAALRKRYELISLEEYLEYRTDQQKGLPLKSLIVTLDDGHKNNYALKPLFQKYGIRSTIFLCSGLAGTNRHFWFETEMDNAVRQQLKILSNDERLQVLAEMGFSESAEQKDRQALSAREIEEMKGLVNFQSHTVFHPVLPRCSESGSLTEISASKAELESKFGLSINALAYPNGDYTLREIEAAHASGYQCALSLDPGFNSRETPAFQLRRICINDDAGVAELLVKASGVWSFLRKAKSYRLRTAQPSSLRAEQAT